MSIRIDDRDPRISYTGNWSQLNHHDPDRPTTFSSTSSNGSSMSLDLSRHEGASMKLIPAGAAVRVSLCGENLVVFKGIELTATYSTDGVRDQTISFITSSSGLDVCCFGESMPLKSSQLLRLTIYVNQTSNGRPFTFDYASVAPIQSTTFPDSEIHKLQNLSTTNSLPFLPSLSGSPMTSTSPPSPNETSNTPPTLASSNSPNSTNSNSSTATSSGSLTPPVAASTSSYIGSAAFSNLLASSPSSSSQSSTSSSQDTHIASIISTRSQSSPPSSSNTTTHSADSFGHTVPIVVAVICGILGCVIILLLAWLITRNCRKKTRMAASTAYLHSLRGCGMNGESPKFEGTAIPSRYSRDRMVKKRMSTVSERSVVDVSLHTNIPMARISRDALLSKSIDTPDQRLSSVIEDDAHHEKILRALELALHDYASPLSEVPRATWSASEHTPVDEARSVASNTAFTAR